MNTESITKVVEIINNNIEGAAITEENYDDDLSEKGMDSFTFIRIIVALEEAFGCEIPDTKIFIGEMNTVNKIIRVLRDVTTY